MTLRDDPDTEKKIAQLVTARAHEDYQRANELLRELNRNPDDSFLLILMLTRKAADLAHEVQRDFQASITPPPADYLTGAERVALQLIATMANDDLPTAADLAMATVRVGGVNPRHTQAVIVELVDIVATGGARPMLVAAPMADPRLN